MRNRGRQFNVAHAFSANLGPGDFNTAAVADHAFIAYSFVFSAVTFPVLGGAEDAFAEKTVSFRFQRPVIDGFRFFYFTVGPFPDLFRRRQGNAHTIKITYIYQGLSLLSFTVKIRSQHRHHHGDQWSCPGRRRYRRRTDLQSHRPEPRPDPARNHQSLPQVRHLPGPPRH